MDKFKASGKPKRFQRVMAGPLKLRLVSSILILFLSFSILSTLPGNVVHLAVHAQPASARLELWSPDVHSSNITDPVPVNGSGVPSKFPIGSQFTVLLNVTKGGAIAAFDISVNYNLTI